MRTISTNSTSSFSCHQQLPSHQQLGVGFFQGINSSVYHSRHSKKIIPNLFKHCPPNKFSIATKFTKAIAITAFLPSLTHTFSTLSSIHHKILSRTIHDKKYTLPPFVVSCFQKLGSEKVVTRGRTDNINMSMLLAATAAAAAAAAVNSSVAECESNDKVIEDETLNFSGRWCLDHSTSDEVWGMMKSLGAPSYFAPFVDTGELTYVVVHKPREHLWQETMMKRIGSYLPPITRENIFFLDGREVEKRIDGGSIVTVRAFVEHGMVVTETEHPKYDAAQRIERRLLMDADQKYAKEYHVRNIVSFRNKDGTGITTKVYRRNFVREEDYSGRKK
jgi:hypothetical protein